MDAVISQALEEICSQGEGGIGVTSLMKKLEESVPTKEALWANLLKIPSLEFDEFSRDDERIQSFENAQKLNVKIVPKQHLCFSFYGLYEDSNLTLAQRCVLQRLASARTNGITQNQLCKELGMEGKNFFYVVKNLESRGFIVRQPALVKTRESGKDGEYVGCSNVVTNMMYLSRYAQHLDSQQRIEILKEQTLGIPHDDEDNFKDIPHEDEESTEFKEDIRVKDFSPAIKAICDELEKADGEVLVVTDIKKDLGYAGAPSGHKAWRAILNRLKDSKYVEEFDAKVNGKVQRCLRLLKSFSSKKPEPDTLISEDKFVDKNLEIRFGRRCPITSHLVELPIEHQVYDIVDAEGPEGITVKEVCARLGISNKKSYTRLCNMSRRFGIHMQAETDKKAKGYRLWTPGNYTAGWRKASTSAATNRYVEKSNSDVGSADVPESSALHSSNSDPSVLEGELSSSKYKNDKEADTEFCQESAKKFKPNNTFVCYEKPQEGFHNQIGTALDQETGVRTMETETSIVLSQTTPPSLKPKRSRSDFVYPCLPTVDHTRREQMIMERIKDEKFILRPELYRWLVNLEKDKGTTLDRKTVNQILKDLQERGHCKCVYICVPLITNCSHSRLTQVVVHPNQSMTELTGEIHDRLRSFEIQSHGQAATKSKNDESVPILSGVQRTRACPSSDAGVIKSVTMRANGFVLAKMVRTKLLHIFLWEYANISQDVNALPCQRQVNDQKNPHTSYCLFSLEAAIKSVPLELFLQVVGSTQNFDDMVEKCKNGLCLSDLPPEEYRCLMDTHATGRLSRIIDMLRRLKLIRLVTSGESEDVDKAPHVTFTHALELKPYIEEPSSLVTTSSNFDSSDLRPPIRHDFNLSNIHSVNDYWKTLEYCYATADPKAALHSFPGSAVNAVFLYRSWASVRIMSADQRAQLLKRIVMDDPDKKLPFKECEEIANDLNLTLEQVLRVYYDKRQRNQYKLLASKDRNQPSEVQCALASRERKRTSRKPKNHDGIEHSDEEYLNPNDHMEEQGLLSCPVENHNDHLIDAEETGQNEEDQTRHSVGGQHASSKMKLVRQRRFSWTTEADRKLVLHYARYRAMQGAKFHRVDWSSLSGLPAPPSACQKRMASLNRHIKFRKALMRLCNILSRRYVDHLKISKEGENILLSNNGERLNRGSSVQDILQRGLSNVTDTRETYLEKELWDDFDDKSINSALEEVLHSKQIAKLEAPRRLASVSEKRSDLYMHLDEYDQQDSELISTATPSGSIHQAEGHKDSARRSRYRFRQKFIKLLNDDTCGGKHIYESLAVSNAVELIKLVFLSTSTTPEVANLLAETLRHYSEHDLSTAFTYLRENKIMIGGTVGQPYELSQKFLHSISRSPFPANTGTRAAKFSSWLHNRQNDLLMGEEISLPPDLECGDILTLFSLVSSGDLSIAPCLPDEGVGEADDLRSSKRKNDYKELDDGAKAKKLKSLTESEYASRREKGFPGIKLNVSRSAISTAADIVEIFKKEPCSSEVGRNDGVNDALNLEIGCTSLPDHTDEILITNSTKSLRGNSSSTTWKAMSRYAQQLMSMPLDQEGANLLHSEIFKDVSAAILKAGDQGLSLSDISQVINTKAFFTGYSMAKVVVKVLETFGQAFKVNAYNSVQVVDALYRSKYFLTPKALCRQDSEQPSTSGSLDNIGDDHLIDQEIHDKKGENLHMETGSQFGDVHKVTILNLPEPEGVTASLHKDETCNVNEGCCPKSDVTVRGHDEPESSSYSGGQFVPVLPWINGDGTINKFIYKGLVRRVLGIVTQNHGILEDDIIMRMNVLNPQSCRKLLELMIRDKHLMVRKMHQTISNGPPPLLLGSVFKSKIVSRDHFFATIRSTSIL